MKDKAWEVYYKLQTDDANSSTDDGHLKTWVTSVVGYRTNEEVLLCELIRRRRDSENLNVLDSYMAADFLESSLCEGQCSAESLCVFISTFDSRKVPYCERLFSAAQTSTLIQITRPLVSVLQ